MVFLTDKHYQNLIGEIRALREALEKKQDYGQLSTALMRRLLGSIDASEEVNEEVFNNRAGAIFDIIEPKLNKMVREQERFTTAEALDWFQAVFGRGTLNGIELVLKEFKDAHDIYQQAHQPPIPPSDPHNPIPEI